MKKHVFFLLAFAITMKLFAQSSDNPTWKWAGSGFAISEKYVATNYHVVDGANVMKISGVGGDFTKKYNVEVVASDKNNDLAIVKVTDKDFSGFVDIPYAIFPDNVDVGTEIFVLGYPLPFALGQEVKVTNGIISSKTGFQNDVTRYQMTAPIQAGNSGGPVFDYKGNMIAVSVAGVNSSVAENVLYSVKSVYLKNLAESCTEKINIAASNALSTLSLAEKVKRVSPYVVQIQVYDGSQDGGIPQTSISNSDRLLAERLLYVAHERFMNKDYKGAYMDLCESVRTYPIPAAHYMRAVLALQYVNDTNAAVESYKYCVDNKYNLTESMHGLSVCYRLLNKFDMAIDICNKLILADSRDVKAYFTRALCKDTLGDKSAALIDYMQILRFEGAIDYDYGTVYNNIAYLYVRMKNYEMAKKYIAMALKRNTMEGYIWDTDGELAYRMGDYAKCIKSMNNAIIIDGNNDNSYFFRGMAKLKTGDMFGAKQDLENAKLLKNKRAADSLLLVDITQIDVDKLLLNNGRVLKQPETRYMRDSYRVDYSPRATVKTVEILPEYTAITFTLEGVYNEHCFSVRKDVVLTASYGSSRDDEVKLPLIATRNCSIYPEKRIIEKGDTEDWVLIFPAVNKGCKKFILQKPIDAHDCPEWVVIYLE